MRIYIDFDDVLCETARALSEVARERFKRDVPYEQITVFNLQHAFSLSGDEIELLMDLAHEIEFLADLEPAPGAVEAVKKLYADGHEVVVVTGRPSSCHEGSVNWLKRFGLEFIEVVYVDKYGRAPKELPEGSPPMLSLDEFYELSFDAAIDDSPTALDLLTKISNCKTIIYDRPWNRGYNKAADIPRCSGWGEILELF